MDQENTTTQAQAEAAPEAPNTERAAPAEPAAARGRKEEDDDRSQRKSYGLGGKDARGRSRRRRKVSFLTINKISQVDYKDTNLLRRFVNEQGKILSSRQTGATAKEQRMIATAVRRAREMALMPFVALDSTTGDRRGGGERRSYRSNYNREAPGSTPPAVNPNQQETPPAEAQPAPTTE